MDVKHDQSEGTSTAMTPALWCQAFFIGAAAGILFVQGLPKDLSGALLTYGARSVKDQNQNQNQNQNQEKDKDGGKKTLEAKKSSIVKTLRGLIVSMSDYAQVPHHWFLHFYILAVSWSIFWAVQYVQKGSIMRAIATRQAQSGGPSMELGQVFVAWTLMFIQGLRRLYESLFVTKSGSSPMFIAHWLLGVAYYTFNLLTAWVEGSAAILESWESPQQPVRVLTPKIVAGTLLFLFASYKQNECHRYLASLKKYTLPEQGWFKYIISPHYTSECLIYVALSLVAAPPGSLFNRTELCGLTFVVITIGVIAHGTKDWYAKKFGAEKVAGRWKMIPPVF